MNTSDDLSRVTPLLWQTLDRFGVPFYRCGVFVVDEKAQHIAMYMSDARGEPVASIDLPWDVHPVVAATVDHWRRSETYLETLSREKYVELVEIVQSGIQDLQGERYIDPGSIPEQMIMHILPFTQGTLYVGNAERLSPEDVAFVSDLAVAFSVAYARYLDFQAVEAQNRHLEEALAQLGAAQQQLILQEKMASLGNLVAGVVHEINTPLGGHHPQRPGHPAEDGRTVAGASGRHRPGRHRRRQGSSGVPRAQRHQRRRGHWRRACLRDRARPAQIRPDRRGGAVDGRLTGGDGQLPGVAKRANA